MRCTYVNGSGISPTCTATRNAPRTSWMDVWPPTGASVNASVRQPPCARWPICTCTRGVAPWPWIRPGSRWRSGGNSILRTGPHVPSTYWPTSTKRTAPASGHAMRRQRCARPSVCPPTCARPSLRPGAGWAVILPGSLTERRRQCTARSARCASAATVIASIPAGRAVRTCGANRGEWLGSGALPVLPEGVDLRDAQPSIQ